MSYLCLHCNTSQWKISFGGTQGRKSTHKLVVCDLWRNMIGGHHTGSWWCKEATVSTRLRFSERMRYLRAYHSCENNFERFLGVFGINWQVRIRIWALRIFF